jgi:hypothetical protein
VDVNNYTETKGHKKTPEGVKILGECEHRQDIAYFDARKSTLVFRARSFAPDGISAVGQANLVSIPFRVLGGSRIWSLVDGLPAMSNCCCLAGRAGGTPILV